MQNEIELKNRVRMWRAEKRISQDDLAEMVGVSRQTISSIENLQFCPSAKLALLICIALDKKFEEVFYFE
jgi:putative transcriptional regulator